MVAQERSPRARHVHFKSIRSRDDCLISGVSAASRLRFQFRNTSLQGDVERQRNRNVEKIREDTEPKDSPPNRGFPLEVLEPDLATRRRSPHKSEQRKDDEVRNT